jgi:hypothetical protein
MSRIFPIKKLNHQGPVHIWDRNPIHTWASGTCHSCLVGNMTFVKPVQKIKRWEQKCHQSKIQVQTSDWGFLFFYFFIFFIFFRQNFATW